jgi:hypothetical protein
LIAVCAAEQQSVIVDQFAGVVAKLARAGQDSFAATKQTQVAARMPADLGVSLKDVMLRQRV